MLSILKKSLFGAAGAAGAVGGFTANEPALISELSKFAFPVISNVAPVLTTTEPVIGPSKPLHDTEVPCPMM